MSQISGSKGQGSRSRWVKYALKCSFVALQLSHVGRGIIVDGVITTIQLEICSTLPKKQTLCFYFSLFVCLSTKLLKKLLNDFNEMFNALKKQTPCFHLYLSVCPIKQITEKSCEQILVIFNRQDVTELLKLQLTLMHFYARQHVMFRTSQPSSRRLSVRPFITPWHCIKMVTSRITESAMQTSPRILVYCDKILCLGMGVSLERGHEIGVPP